MYSIPASTVSGAVAHFLRAEGDPAAESVRYYLAIGDSVAVRLILAGAPDTPAVRLALALAAGRRADVDRALGGYQRTGAIDID